MIKLKNLLFEGRSKKISRRKIEEYLSSEKFDFDPSSTQIRRSITGFNDMFGIVRPKQASKKRISRSATRNFYTLWMDNVDKWSKYPKRSESVVCRTSNIVGGYLVIPVLGSNIGICSDADIWASFKDYNELKEFNVTLDKIFSFYLNETYNTPLRDFYRLKELISNVDNVIENTKASYSDFIDSNRGSIYAKFVEKFLESNFDSLFGYINYSLDPERNGFRRVNYSTNFEAKPDKEVWTDGPCLLIRDDMSSFSSIFGSNVARKLLN